MYFSSSWSDTPVTQSWIYEFWFFFPQNLLFVLICSRQIFVLSRIRIGRQKKVFSFYQKSQFAALWKSTNSFFEKIFFGVILSGFGVLYHGIQMPNEAFFHRNPKLLNQTIWVDKFWGIWGIFGWFISNPFWYCESLVHVFH